MAMQPPDLTPSEWSPLGRSACGLVYRPERGVAPWLTEDGPHTAPSSRQSLPGPLVGSRKINKQP